MMNIQQRLSALEAMEPKVLINIPIHKWIEADRKELEEITGIVYLLGNETNRQDSKN